MSKASNIYIATGVCLLVSAGAAGLFITRTAVETATPSEAEFLIDIKPQLASRRTIKAVLTKKEMSIGGLQSEVLLAPVSVKALEDGTFYVLDWGDRSVKGFKTNGALLHRYGKRIGSGPGEMKNPTDFQILPDKRVLVCDPVNGRVDIFNPHAALLESIRLPVVVYRMATIRNDTLAVISSPIGEELFSVVTLSGSKVASFGRLLRNQQGQALLLDGYLASGSGGQFIYVSLYAGMLLCLEASGMTRFARATIDGHSLPKLLSVKRGETRLVRVDPGSPWSSLSVNVHEGRIYLLANRSLDQAGGRVVDVYREDDGEYVESFGIQDACKSAFVTSNYVFTVNDTSVSRWPR